jgi:acyl-CoA thioester hydrolase
MELLVKIRVYYEDTDCGGVVYYANYLNFCERARSELFFQKGLSPHKNDEFFVVKSVQADYIKSAVFGDILEVKTKLVERKAASIVMYQEVFRDEELLFKATIKLAFLKNFKPSKIPLEIFDIFE